MAGKLNLIIEKNAAFKKRLRYLSKTKRPVNLTGYAAKLQARTTVDSEVVLFELSTENDGITLDSQGYITLHLTLTQVVALSAFTTAGYDLLLLPPDGEWDKLLEGKVTTSIGFTRTV